MIHSMLGDRHQTLMHVFHHDDGSEQGKTNKSMVAKIQVPGEPELPPSGGDILVYSESTALHSGIYHYYLTLSCDIRW